MSKLRIIDNRIGLISKGVKVFDTQNNDIMDDTTKKVYWDSLPRPFAIGLCSD